MLPFNDAPGLEDAILLCLVWTTLLMISVSEETDFTSAFLESALLSRAFHVLNYKCIEATKCAVLHTQLFYIIL